MQFAAVLMAAATQGVARDPSLAAYLAAAVANGGAPTPAYESAVSQFISAEKAAGLWDLTDDYLPLWAPDAATALTSLKQLRLATVTAAPTFTADRGYAFNGTTQFINTGFVPSTHAVTMTLNSTHAEVYERTNVSSTASSLGANSGSNRAIVVFPRDASTVLVAANGVGGVYTLSPLTSAGLTQFGRNGATTADVYGAKNGVNLTQTSPLTALGASLPSNSFYVGGVNLSGSLFQARAASVGYVAWGASLTGAQRLARYTNVQAFATAVGAQV